MFLKLCIEKCLKYYYEKFGDKYKTLFRNDIFLDDILKNINFIFSNCLFFKDYSKYYNINQIHLITLKTIKTIIS